MSRYDGRTQGPWGNPGFLLWRATLHWQFVVLASTWWLGREGRPPSQRELADHTGMDPMTASQVARTLEGKGLITRTPDAHDSRAKRLTITPDGQALAHQAMELVETVDSDYFGQAPDHDALVRNLLALATPPRTQRPEGGHSP